MINFRDSLGRLERGPASTETLQPPLSHNVHSSKELSVIQSSAIVSYERSI